MTKTFLICLFVCLNLGFGQTASASGFVCNSGFIGKSVELEFYYKSDAFGNAVVVGYQITYTNDQPGSQLPSSYTKLVGAPTPTSTIPPVFDITPGDDALVVLGLFTLLHQSTAAVVALDHCSILVAGGILSGFLLQD